MTVNVPALLMSIFFYAFVLGIGIWASIKSKKLETAHNGWSEILFLANRSVDLFVGTFTMAATWIGGGFILGTAEVVYDPTKGLVWALVPLQCTVSFLIGGLFFAKPMRGENYISMMDPFQKKYGRQLTAILAIVPVISEVLWTAGVLTTLGATMSVVLNLLHSLCVWISAAVAIVYTVLGGLYSVASTDVIQISLVLLGMWLCVPFILVSDKYADITQTAFNNTYQAPWLGHLDSTHVGKWIDEFLVLALGSMAIQDFHQRTLSSSSTSVARRACFLAAGVVFFAGIPSTLIGAVAASVDWNSTLYGPLSPYERGEIAMVLPATIHSLAPTYIFAFCIGAVGAAVMSSVDSYLLSATTIFTTNIYPMIRNQASDMELKWVIRLSIVIAGVIGTSLTRLSKNVMVFWMLGSDLSYTVILPQLICVLFTNVSNGFGACAGYLVGLTMRVLCGEPMFGIPVILKFGGYIVEDDAQQVPVKTICMLASLISILVFSILASFLFNKGFLPEKWDVFQVKSQAILLTGNGTILYVADKTDGDDK